MKTSHPRRRPTPTLFLKTTLVLGAIVAAVALAAQTRSLAIDDLRLHVEVSSLALSPDGRTAVVVTSRANYEDNRFDQTLVLVDIATGVQRNVTPNRPKVDQPRWSPSGRHLAFVDADKDGRRQIYLLPMDGGDEDRTNGDQLTGTLALKPIRARGLR